MKVAHGGNKEALALEMGFSPDECLDFSANINPLGLSQKMLERLEASFRKLVHYPDVDYKKSKAALADFHACSSQQILLSNGAVDLFYELARTVRPANLLILSPTFMEYEKAFGQVGSEIHYHVLTGPQYEWDFQSILPDLQVLSAGDLVLVCNPNNPTGSLVSNQVLIELAGFLKEREISLVIDEAFMDFVEDSDAYTMIPYLDECQNVIVVRSLTKFYAIPGLRLGYAVSSDSDLLATIEEYRPPWTINTLADELLPVLLQDKDYQLATQEWLKREQEFLYQTLAQFRQLKVVRPSVNYIFFEYEGEADLRQLLWREKIFIRSCQDYHHLNRQHYRVAVRSREENQQLIRCLTAVLRKCESYD